MLTCPAPFPRIVRIPLALRDASVASCRSQARRIPRMINTLLAKVIGTQNDRELKRLRPARRPHQRARIARSGAVATRTCAAGPRPSRARVAAGAPLDDLLPEAFAVVREAGRRVLNMRHFDVQLIGGMVLHGGRIAEMKTGEGKTLVATLPAYLNALEGQGRPRRHRQRLPGPARLGVDGPHLPLPRHVGRRHPARPERRRAAGRLRRGHHLRHEQRVRLRLPARQHEVRAVALRPARPPLRHRRRGGQHPHRRGADAADHFGAGRGVDRPLLRGRSHHPEARRRAR